MSPRPSPTGETLAVTSSRRGSGSALAPALVASATFAATDPAGAARSATSRRPVDFYTRLGNPTVQAFADAVAELEGAEAGMAFSSGMGAVTSTVLSLCSQGDHIVAQRQLFTSTAMLFAAVCPRFGIEVTFVDAVDTEALVAAVRPGRTTLVFVETPSNPTMEIVDLAAVGGLRGPITVVDSTFATPLGQRPLDHGVDLVIHSATKALSGHNDATLGVAVGDTDLVDHIWGYSVIHGACASPFDSWNGLRGLKTLGVRLERQSANALRIARWLEDRPEVERVLYPGLASHPQADLASAQMESGGGCLSFVLTGGTRAAGSFMDALELVLLAPSLGGTETLANHPASMTHAALTPEERAEQGIADGMVRLSVGVESVEDLLADLETALAAIGG
ncbi:MAG TPA: PLP-dependent transferase [Acidimicrobiales bacterium]|nr:PLP-dependent transferase [Acidimicrobiales bacterium]